MRFRDLIPGLFEVYSTISGEALSDSMDIDAALAEMEKVHIGAGMAPLCPNGAVDIRRVVS